MTHLLVIASVWPEPNSSAAGSRMLQLLQLFTTQGWNITFAATAAFSEQMADIESLGISLKKVLINDASFDTFITTLQPTIVLYDRFMIEEQFGWRVTKHCPNAMTILNTEDLHSLRKVRHEIFKKNKKFTTNTYLLHDTTKREIACIYRCDLTLMISDAEIQLLTETLSIPHHLIHYIPLLYDPIDESTTVNWPCYKDRKHFITIGNFRHAPNWQSVLHLQKDIWPIIRKQLPDAEIHIYGAYPPPKATQLHQPNRGFHIKGWTTDSLAVMQQARVCLAPIQFGAGIKGKLIEAMRCGTPSITTDIGAEGIAPPTTTWSGRIENDTTAIANAAIQLYTDPDIWHTAQQRGVEIINSRFQKKLFEPSLISRIETIAADLPAHRSKNFIGSLLQHHTLRSTEYMSRWIEEKNKHL